jgi:hypothetical protein
MKKIAFATILALSLATSAMAVEVKIEAQESNGQSGTADQRVFELGLKQKINENFAGDIVVKNYRTDGTDVLATRYEAGLTGSATINGPLSGYTRVAIGERYKSGSAGYSYYSVEPGLGVAFSYFPGLSASVGYRFQDAFADGKSDLTRTWRTKVGYDLTKVDNVYVGYDVQRGDSDANIAKIGYIRRF